MSFFTYLVYVSKSDGSNQRNRCSSSYGFHKNKDQVALLLWSICPCHRFLLFGSHDWNYCWIYYGTLISCILINSYFLLLSMDIVLNHHWNEYFLLIFGNLGSNKWSCQERYCCYFQIWLINNQILKKLK